ncbi:MAG: hypothetical protein K6B70_05375 [Clostridia bacterium]|nr:hypothetical protein [Clostridia bacterium]
MLDKLIENKELMEEWDYDKNYDLDPTKLKVGSGKKAWWICKLCGNKWQTQIYLRKNHGCPSCAHKRVGLSNAKIKDEKNSLINKFPDVVKVWNYEKNKGLNPEDYLYQSNKKVWWKCSKCGKEWQTPICAKSHTTICKECTYTDNKRVYVKKGVNDIETKNPELLKEWDYNKNTITPNQISPKSAKMVWWKCEKGHSWKNSPLNRTKHEASKCPYCSNQKILKGFNDFATLYPNLLKEWDYEKNEANPYDIIKGSHLKFYWKCQKGHSYITSVGNRIRGTGCPYCAGQKVLKGFNDLATTNPELVKEWDYEKNIVKPDEISSGSGLNVWWKCENGHSWKSIITNRTKNGKRGCPTCSNRVLLKGFNDLATTNPELLKEWDYEKNKIRPNEIIAGTIKKVWWKCEKGHEWYATVVSRTKKHFCPICNSYRQTSFSEKSIVYYLNKANIELIENYKIGRKELDVFIPKENIGIEYDGQYFHKSIKKDLEKNKLCENNKIKLIRIREPELPILNSTSIDFKINSLTSDHSYMNDIIKKLLDYLNIKNIDVDVERDFNEIYSLFQKGEKKDSIVDEFPELMKEWDYDKNTDINPEFISKGVHINVWWKCQKCGHSWQSAVYSRTYGSGCPKCSGRLNAKKPSKLKIGENDFQTEYPKLAKEWDYNKNELRPNELTSGSNKKVWWLCGLNHSYEANVANRVKGTGCPYCANKKVLKGYNDLITTNPSLAKEWNYKKNTIKPDEVMKFTKRKVWWVCSKGHEWQADIGARSAGSGCPVCSGRQTLSGYNDLKTTNPELIEFWDYGKNLINPDEVGKGSHVNIWWKCVKCGQSYSRKVYQQVERKAKCPICKYKK